MSPLKGLNLMPCCKVMQVRCEKRIQYHQSRMWCLSSSYIFLDDSIRMMQDWCGINDHGGWLSACLLYHSYIDGGGYSIPSNHTFWSSMVMIYMLTFRGREGESCNPYYACRVMLCLSISTMMCRFFVYIRITIIRLDKLG